MKLKTNTMLLRLALSVAVGATALTAGPITANGSFGFETTGGSISYVGAGDLTTATSITIPTPGAPPCGANPICMQINTINPLYLGIQNDFAAGGNTPLAINQDVSLSSYIFNLNFSSAGTISTAGMSSPPMARFAWNSHHLPS